ncbi:CRISPR-associated endonuclease/helicase Cas3 [Anaerolineae bacterium]|nr:CRISPR-associated endonuclease/helicase Cas3 [Anaerolineae bacterium]
MTTLRVWPDWLQDTWAKSADKGAGGQPETLAEHTWRVLEKLAETIRLRPTLPAQIGVPRLWHCLFWAAFLHDFGKAAQGFQARLRPGGEKWLHRHEVLSLAFVDWISAAFTDEEQRWLVAAIVSHHKDEDRIRQDYNTVCDPTDQSLNGLVAELNESTLRGLWRWLNECPASWVEALNLTEVGISVPTLPDEDTAIGSVQNTGSASIRKWLKIYHRWVEHTINRSDESALLIGTIALRGHLISSDHMASAHVGDLPSSQLADPDRLLVNWQLTVADLYPHQHASLNARGSVVLMAPTGSGKTEAALLWSVAQARPQQPVPRLYYTLPFQASMNAMQRRLNDDERDGQGQVIRTAPFKDQVGLEHSRSTLAYYRKLQEDDYTPEQAAKQAKWLNNLARLNYYPVRVLSPYQLLKAPYRLKGYETLLTDCFEAAFIFDEIHAYDAGRLAKILATVKYLREGYGALFFVMSATLPKLLRDQLADALGHYQLIEASAATYAQFRRHALILKDGDLLEEASLQRIAQVAKSGQAVLVCCNTVDRAQTAWQGLRERLQKTAPSIKVELLHGRFNARDRLRKEDIVRKATGSRSTQREAIVLVATQVVEVSLDIDLDVIYTDPAPLEALLQRFGRINRRRLKECAPVCVFREPVPEKERPYDPALIKAALRVLEQHQGQLIDEAQISAWLDEVYADASIAGDWLDVYQSSYEEFSDSTLLSLRPFQSNDQLKEAFYQAFDSVEVLPMGLSDEYEKLRDEDPLKASELLVPIRWSMYASLANRGKVREDEYLKEVDAYYSPEKGLDFKHGFRDDEDV